MRTTGALVLAAAVLGAAAPAPPGEKIHRKTADYEYAWEIPRAAAAIPAFAAKLRAEALKAAAGLAKDAAEGRQDATKPEYFHAYDGVDSFAVTANTPRLLALTESSWAYTGGAHGNGGTAARLWDKKLGREIKIADLFTDWPEAVRRLTPGYCRVLDAERLKRREQPTPKTDLFGGCPSLMKEATVVPMATRGGDHITKLAVSLDQYVAGPYSEGPYELTLVLAPRALELLKPEWR